MYNRLPAPTVEIFPGAYARAAAAASDNLRHLSPDALAAGRTPDRSLVLSLALSAQAAVVSPQAEAEAAPGKHASQSGEYRTRNSRPLF